MSTVQTGRRSPPGHVLGLGIHWPLRDGRVVPVGAVWADDAEAVRAWARGEPWSVRALVERALDELPVAPAVGEPVGVGLACVLWSRVDGEPGRLGRGRRR